MRTICPCCGQTIRQTRSPKPAAAVQTVDPASLTDAQLFTHYKATAPIEDLRFFIRHCRNTDIQQAATALLAASFAPGTEKLYGNRSEFYRKLSILQGEWRRLRNLQERSEQQTVIAA